jgi:hypothetical protein
MTQLLNMNRMGLLQEKIKRRLDKNFLELIVITSDKGKVEVKVDEEFAQLQQLHDYIEQCLAANAKIFVLRVVTSSLVRYMPETFDLELRYVYQFAPSRNEAIRKEIAAFKGVCHLFEITDAFLARLGLSQNA